MREKIVTHADGARGSGLRRLSKDLQTRGAKLFISIIWSFVLLAVAAPTLASTFDGVVDEVAIGSSPTQSGYVRVSIRVAAHASPCGTPLWFVYEYSNTDIVGKTWTAAFMAIKESGQSARINGSGTCDPYSVEYLVGMHLL